MQKLNNGFLKTFLTTVGRFPLLNTLELHQLHYRRGVDTLEYKADTKFNSIKRLVLVGFAIRNTLIACPNLKVLKCECSQLDSICLEDLKRLAEHSLDHPLKKLTIFGYNATSKTNKFRFMNKLRQLNQLTKMTIKLASTKFLNWIPIIGFLPRL